jgi:hypothetical protein
MEANKKNFFVTDEKLVNTDEFIQIFKEIDEAIASIVWHSTNKFVINPTRRGNGVVPIKKNFVNYLKGKGWKAEERISFTTGINPGPVDVIKETAHGIFVVEWETGNISSTHRSLNKIAIGLKQKRIIGGIVVLPTKAFASFLTDRVGNYEEIEPYFDLFVGSLNSVVMGVYAIEHDETSIDSPLIPKGQDGNAKKKKKSKKVIKKKSSAKKTVSKKKIVPKKKS